jgi:hypothetical protein
MGARRAWGTGLAVVGAVGLIGAGVLAWVVVPNRKQLPADTFTTRDLDGTAKVVLDAQALSAGDFRAALKVDTPVTAQRTVAVKATDGSAAEVSDQRQLTAGGQSIGQSQVTYAVDRTSLEATTPASGWQVTPHQGLTVSFPIGSQKQQYTGWVSETQTTTPLNYDREESRGGIATYVYTAKTAAAPIKDPQVLASLPAALPTTALGALAAVLPIPPELQAALAKALPQTTEPVPLSYTYESTATYWVEPTTGVVVDTEREEIRKAGVGSGALSVTGLPIYDVTTRYTSASVTAAATDAKNARDSARVFGTVVPWALAGVGAVLLVVGLVLALTRRRPA